MLTTKEEEEEEEEKKHRCTRFENPGGGFMRFSLNFGREVVNIGVVKILGARVHLFGVLLHFY